MHELYTLKQRLHKEMAHGHAVVFVGELEQLQNFAPVLTAAECAKFDRVRLTDQRRLHALGRGLVRYFLDLPGSDFSVGASGKLSFAGAAAFNISHTGRTIAIAFHRRCPVGVDIEATTRDVQDDALIARVCHPQEAHWITQQPAHLRTHAFLRCWVRKEAVLKAQGTGLVDDLQAIDTRLQDRFAVLPEPHSLRLWDFPQAFCADHGALAATQDVIAVSYLSPTMTTLQRWPLRHGSFQTTSDNDKAFDDLRS